MIAVLGAMKEEVDALLDSIEGIEKTVGKCADYFCGKLEDKDVVVAKTGIGKVLSALSAAEMINRFKPDVLLFSGIAGGISDKLEIGDLVVGTECIQYDFDVTALGFPLGKIPYSPYHEIPGDSGLIDLVRTFRTGDYRIHYGRILTGDSFITDKHQARLGETFKELDGLAVEMEGASVALTAAVYNVPVLVLRFISDKADGHAPGNFQDFLKLASMHSLAIIRYILRNLQA